MPDAVHTEAMVSDAELAAAHAPSPLAIIACSPEPDSLAWANAAFERLEPATISRLRSWLHDHQPRGRDERGGPQPLLFAGWWFEATPIERGGAAAWLVAATPSAGATPAARRESDPVTGALTRSAFDAELVAWSSSPASRRFAVAFIDVDDFKAINDRWGHLVGDRTLATLVERLREVVRSGDVVGRFGGDEFVLLLDGAAGLADWVPIDTRLREALAEPYRLDEGSAVPIRCSLGVAFGVSGPGCDAAALLAEADRAMYDDKRAAAVD